MEYKVQSIVFEKDKISLEEAVDMILTHKDKVKKLDITETQYRFRQLEPKYLKRKGYTKYITKKINDVISFIIAYKEN